MVLMESGDSEDVPLLVWRVCDQAFGRRVKGAEKWSCDHKKLKIFIYTHVEKFSDSKNAIFLIYDEK